MEPLHRRDLFRRREPYWWSSSLEPGAYAVRRRFAFPAGELGWRLRAPCPRRRSLLTGRQGERKTCGAALFSSRRIASSPCVVPTSNCRTRPENFSLSIDSERFAAVASSAIAAFFWVN